MSHRRAKIAINQTLIVRIFLGFLLTYGLFVVVKAISQSSILFKRDRVNIIYYGARPSIESIGYADGVNYIGFFDQGSQVYIPGGYGRYKIGALGRLVEIEHKPQIIQRAFSSALSTYIDFYFYPKKSQIYSFDPPSSQKAGSVGGVDFFIPRLSILDVILARNFNTNAGLFDRLSLFIATLDKKRSDFSRLKISSTKDTEGDRILVESSLDKKYQGYFYEKTLREEGKSVQILYTNYKSATILTRIIEGEGIRVADLSKLDKPSSECIIKESGKQKSHSAQYLQQILQCRYEQAVSHDADMILILGDKVEKEWE